MAVLTLQQLDRVEFGAGTTYERSDAAVTSGYKAYIIPNLIRGQLTVAVKVNTAANYNIEYSTSPRGDIAAGTQRLWDAFGGAQTTSQDVELPINTSLIVVTMNSGTSIDIEVRAK